MEHNYWEERIQGYMDNELPPADHTAVKNHIEGCSACTAQLEYFRCLKKRLRLHRDTVAIPQCVEQRIIENVKKKSRRRFVWKPAYSLAMAAVAVLAIALPLQLRELPYCFVNCDIKGRITCTDCEIATKAGMQAGDFCSRGHNPGLIDEDGRIYRIALDKEERWENFMKREGYYGKLVEIQGDILHQENLVRVDRVRELVVETASL